ncbi:MAG: FKBP-type peptidyl-prolyl cis-trans isomerase [Bacteroidaceae bacterium]|jgi:FKBP-type peptidyl-prolyl cis-trans isomerase FklB|nr:FKBP-type peptidyl-prolyl cis-trans isomerase [Bacteroidaceae bacterium]MBO5885417.1 FKBP-type peptidyl-prolyl cis-trans isomerase [Bacteroidaceae bacterium]MBO7172083.1 FKBP-type peptidyl-prolyl cis-trans isomerase [Bacteroidaceae bacterium]MBQ2011684.1 FKBP-type peptidyl-prolyl cis-trans isomerase [Bacteroidaceae bacterium]MBQ2044311.1 FKBP-type peptidyl-prolyl cis-trans isomerase [Bacteroidaceae bacterium]
MDKISYALGLGIGHQLKNMGIENFSVEDFAQSIKDVMEDKATAMTSQEAQALLNTYFQEKQKAESQKAISEGKAFLEENAKKEGVVTTKSGLQYEILTEGTGKQPKATDTVRCHYEGSLINGSVFDSSYKRGEPAEFGLSQVIPGWTEGVQLMKEGAKYRFYIPYLLGYGENGAGSSIPPYSTLIFDVELIKVL